VKYFLIHNPKTLSPKELLEDFELNVFTVNDEVFAWEYIGKLERKLDEKGIKYKISDLKDAISYNIDEVQEIWR